MQPEIITTERLHLIPITASMLRLILSGEDEAADHAAGFTLLRGDDLLPEWLANRRLQMMEDDPAQEPWLLRAIVSREQNVMIGRIGFHAKAGDPDLRPYSDYGAELGYTIMPAYQRRGYAREAVVALMHWAHETHGVASFFVSISPDNAPSLALAASLGFQKIDSRMDDIDGLEYVLRRDVTYSGLAV